MQNIAKAIEDLDKVAIALPKVLGAAKSRTVAENARAIAEMSEMLHLEILLDKPHEEVVSTASQLMILVKQTHVLTMSSRAGQHARMTISLADRLASDVHSLLKEWARQSLTTEAA